MSQFGELTTHVGSVRLDQAYLKFAMNVRRAEEHGVPLSPELKRRVAEVSEQAGPLYREMMKLADEFRAEWKAKEQSEIKAFNSPVPFTGPILVSELAVVMKDSKLTYDMNRLGFTREQMIEEYRRGAENIERIIGSHERQVEALAQIKKILPEATFIQRNDLPGANLTGTKAVIALGGDNHLQFVASQIPDNVAMIGINSDHQTSLGALCSGYPTELPRIRENLRKGSYRLIPWTRLAVKIDGALVGEALCEARFGEKEAEFMSRQLLEMSDGSIPAPGLEQKASGFLVSTGAGSTGWYSSAGQYIHPGEAGFDRSARRLRYVLCEPSFAVAGKAREEISPFFEGCVGEGESFKIVSLNDSSGVVSFDSLKRVPFPRGTQAEISLSNRSLWVVQDVVEAARV